jgi:hypothetical protein
VGGMSGVCFSPSLARPLSLSVLAKDEPATTPAYPAEKKNFDGRNIGGRQVVSRSVAVNRYRTINTIESQGGKGGENRNFDGM